MNIIIVGGGEYGYQLAKELHINHDITVIDIDEKTLDRFSKLDISFILGNGGNAQTLTNAGIETSDILIACTPSDEVNIITCWTAKHLSRTETICFVNHHEYIETFQEKDNKLLTESQFGLDQIIWPKKSLAEELEKIISVPAAIDVEEFVSGKVKLFEYRAKDNAPVINTPLKSCQFPEGCIIVAITRDDNLFIPDGNTVIMPNDKVIFMGTQESLNILGASFFEKHRQEVKMVTIIGGGAIGLMLARNLESKAINVNIIEVSSDRCNVLSSKLSETSIINGDGTDLELLQAHQISESDVLVTVTNNDEKNLLCSLLGKQLGAKKVLTRVDKTSNLKLFETVGIDVALSPKTSSVKELVNTLISTDIDLLATVERGKGEVFKVKIPETFEDTQIKDLRFPYKGIIGAVMRRKKVIVPRGNTLIRSGDSLIIFTTPDASSHIKNYFENNEE